MLTKLSTEENVEIIGRGVGMWEFTSTPKDILTATTEIAQAISILQEARLFTGVFLHKDKLIQLPEDVDQITEFIRKENEYSDTSVLIRLHPLTTVYFPIDSYPGPKRGVDMEKIIYLTSVATVNDNGFIFHVLHVATRSTLWMPFNSAGVPHFDLYALNFGRLTRALHEIDATSMNFNHELCLDFNRYNLSSGFCLENYPDEDSVYGAAEFERR